MLDKIKKTDIPPESVEEDFFVIVNKNDIITVFIKENSTTYYKVQVEVNSIQYGTTEQDDYLTGTIVDEEETVTLRLPWCPSEPEVGISHPYPEYPIQFEYNNTVYDVVSIKRSPL